MSNPPPANAWQSVGRGGRQQPGSASRTPQNRSTTASPSQTQQPTQPPRSQPPQQSQTHPAQPQPQEAKPPTSNAWANRSAAVTSSAGTSTSTPANATNGPPRSQPAANQPSTTTATLGASEDPYKPLNGFNAAEAKAFLARDSGITVYKPAATGGEGNGQARNNGSGGAWGTKASNMANNQPFFVQLAKQVAAFEGGG